MKNLIFVLLIIWANTAMGEPVRVFAAASLKGPLDQAIAEHDVTVSYGGSGLIARQISQGAPADIAIFANPDWAQWLVDQNLATPSDLYPVWSNTLVLISDLDALDVALTLDSVTSALKGGRLAIGRTRSVPAGQYGRAALETLALWEGVAPHLAEVDNVRAALALVERGEVALGLVYETDALASDRVRVVARFPQGSHPTIEYIAVLMPDADARAAEIFDLIVADQAFALAGFVPIKAHDD